MYKITLKNGKSFSCSTNTTIFEAAKNNGIILEHSCLSARCRSCIVQMGEGSTYDKFDDLVLSESEKINNWILSCNAVPTSDIVLHAEDLSDFDYFEKRIIPSKIQSLTKLNETVIEVSLRLPPNVNFRYKSGQYVNISRGDVKRSYSIANSYRGNSGLITFYIKRYEGGLMSKYWFEEAKENDLIRIEGPIGSFVLRDSAFENIIFLATGTGVAPINSILESINESDSKYQNKKIWLIVGARYENDLFWNPTEICSMPNLNYMPVLSKGSKEWIGKRGYVQDVVLNCGIDLSNAQVYACGSDNMINGAKRTLVENGLDSRQFFSDVFVATN